MKKLMIAAAGAAMIGGAYAGSLPEAQVYDVSLTIKTTKAAKAKNVTNKSNPIAISRMNFDYDIDGKNDIIYRAQASVTWKGLIWGCDCESINGVWENATYCGQVTCTIKGCVMWDTKGKAPVYFGNQPAAEDQLVGEPVNLTNDDSLFETVPGAGWGWKFLQSIGKDGKDVEGAWAISSCGSVCDEAEGVPTTDPEDAGQWFCFAGAGFGKANLVTFTDEDGYKAVACTSAIKSISGNFAGWMMAPSDKVNYAGGCAFCGGYDFDVCDYADVWKWCEDFNDVCACTANLFAEDKTAAYGTWTIKYNSSLSKKLTNATTILDAYNFNSLPKVKDAIEIAEKAANQYLIAIREGEASVAGAKEALADAEAANEVAQAALAKAVTAENDAVKRLSDADAVAYAYLNEDYQVYIYKKAAYEVTWGVTYDYGAAQSNRVEKRYQLEVARADATNAYGKVEVKKEALADAQQELKDAVEDCAENCK